MDPTETPFGIRDVKFDPNTGLLINGQHLKMNGVCDHHDLGALGSAVNFRAFSGSWKCSNPWAATPSAPATIRRA